MSNELDFQYIMNRMLSNISDEYDKRETSLIYQSAAMVVPELLLIKSEIQLLEEEAFPDTCGYRNLVKFASSRGIFFKKATPGIVMGEFNIDISIGTRFSCDERNYIVSEQIENTETNLKRYKLMAEETGNIQSIGDLIPIDDIQDLTSAKIVKVLVDGTDDESLDSLRNRYNASLDYQAFGGNRADYINKVLSMDNVAACKIFRRKPATSSELGKIEILILDSTFKDSPVDLISSVQNALQPIGEDGTGLSPIGHFVTVGAVEKEILNIRTRLTVSGETGDILTDVKSKIEEYFQELRYSFGSEDNIIVRLSRIENRLLDIPGVIDVMDTSINGQEKNFIVDDRKIPILGDVTYDRN